MSKDRICWCGSQWCPRCLGEKAEVEPEPPTEVEEAAIWKRRCEMAREEVAWLRAQLRVPWHSFRRENS